MLTVQKKMGNQFAKKLRTIPSWPAKCGGPTKIRYRKRENRAYSLKGRQGKSVRNGNWFARGILLPKNVKSESIQVPIVAPNVTR